MTTPGSGDERRRFSRIPFDAQAVLRAPGGGEWRGRLLDLSLKGALLERPTGWNAEPGADLALEILLDAGACIRMEVAVVHAEADHLGLRCLHIDLDSIAHLRRLMELNLGDSALLDRELSALG